MYSKKSKKIVAVITIIASVALLVGGILPYILYSR
jgi:hypothetical protein